MSPRLGTALRLSLPTVTARSRSADRSCCQPTSQTSGAGLLLPRPDPYMSHGGQARSQRPGTPTETQAHEHQLISSLTNYVGDLTPRLRGCRVEAVALRC